MRSRIVRSVTLVSVVIMLGLGTRASMSGVQAPPATGFPDVLPALLMEVRGLRAAMEQMASAGPRVQLALGRVQLQEQRVNALLRRLYDIRAGVVQAQVEYDATQDALRHADSDLRDFQPGGPSIAMLKDQLVVLQRQHAGATMKLQRANRRSCRGGGPRNGADTLDGTEPAHGGA